MNKNLFLSLSAGAAVVIGSSLYFLSSSPEQDASAPVLAQAPATPLAPSTSQSKPTPKLTTGDRPSRAVDPERYSSNPPKPDYEQEVIALAERVDMSDLDKAKALLARMNSLPDAGKVVALEHATQLIPDENYVQLRPLLFQLSNNTELRDTVLTDVLSRGEKVRMPTMVEMLRQPPNEGQAEVREILLAYLDTDPGNDWAKWDAAVQQFLKDNEED